MCGGWLYSPRRLGNNDPRGYRLPKRAQYTLAWSAERAAYELRDGNQTSVLSAEDWARWLDEHRSFAFQGRDGRLTLLKEGRKADSHYWYAYRRHGARTAKRYAGRSGELTVERLDELARALGDQGEQAVVPQAQARVMTSGTGVAATEPLLAPKLQPPRLHRSLVRCERLLAQLDAGSERTLTLLSAPAGFGKTTLVRQCLAEVAQRSAAPAVAWLSLDRGDDDPLRFWRYLIAACRVFGPQVGAQSWALVEAPLSIKSPLEMILTAFVNELAQIQHEGMLVLEDYHVIMTPQIHEAIGFLLAHLPQNLHLLLITRTTPPLPLARLRAAGELTEIAAPELRFSSSETAAFLTQATAHPFQPDEIMEVESHVEGWAAGLRLLALALEGRADANEHALVMANFLAGRRGIDEYFVGEVLSNQPPSIQRFLLETSFLQSLTASLCDSVTERHDSEAMLHLLEHANLFLEPLDGSGLWYRYHALFAAAMQSEARHRLGEAAVCDLLDRAGRWYEAHAMLDEAIETAFAAADMERATDLVESVAERQFSFERPEMQGPLEFYTMQRWLYRLPPTIMDQRPLLSLALAITIQFNFFVGMQPLTSTASSEIEQWMDKAERGFKAAGKTGRLGQVFAFRALLLRERGEIAASVKWARAALEALPPQELTWRSMCVGNVGIGESTLGHLGNAAERFLEAQSMCEALGNRPFARANAALLGWVYMEQNELHRAAALFRGMLSDARAVGDLDDIGNALHGLAEIALCWNDLDAAWAQAQEVVDIAGQYPHQPFYILAVLILAQVEQARGYSEAALARCAALLAGRESAGAITEKRLNARIAVEQARIALAAGDLAAAQRWRATRPTDLERARSEIEHEELLVACLLMVEGHPDDARTLLEPLLAAAEAEGRGRVALELRVSLALAYAACGDAPSARQTLAAALDAARLANAQRVFADVGEPLAALLRATMRTLSDRNLAAFAKTILQTVDGTSAPVAPTTAEALSPQERRVLRLLTAGRSNPEIADDLVVSVNTVKVHVKNIYRKLNVTSRLEAASTAREQSLL